LEPSLEPSSLSRSSGRARITRWLLILYLIGIVIDLAWHIRFYLSTGDREIEGYEWVIGLQASLFWPLDLLAHGMLALR
jgi:hypothetical protein